MICLVCRKAQTVDGLTSALFERGEMKLEITSIPARVCPDCGDAVVEENVALELLKGLEDLAGLGVKQEIREYRKLRTK